MGYGHQKDPICMVEVITMPKDVYDQDVDVAYIIGLVMMIWGMEIGQRFVGYSSSFQMDDATGVIKGNCIYYTDDVYELYSGSKKRDTRIYHLFDGTIEPHFKQESTSLVTPPIWLQSM
nr:hypothetical protein [Tanacetum cinerariifolium]